MCSRFWQETGLADVVIPGVVMCRCSTAGMADAARPKKNVSRPTTDAKSPASETLRRLAALSSLKFTWVVSYRELDLENWIGTGLCSLTEIRAQSD